MTEEQRDFCRAFEKEYADPIQGMTLARLRGTASSMAALGLTLPPALKELWCLLILGEKAVHIYVHPSESPLAALFRASSGAKAQTAKHAEIPYEQVTEISVPTVKKGFLASFFAKEDYILISYRTADGTAARLTAAVSLTQTAFSSCLAEKAALIAGQPLHTE